MTVSFVKPKNPINISIKALEIIGTDQLKASPIYKSISGLGVKLYYITFISLFYIFIRAALLP